MQKEKDIDNIDKKMLKALSQKDKSINLSELSRTTAISTQTLKKRLKNMQKLGYVTFDEEPKGGASYEYSISITEKGRKILEL